MRDGEVTLETVVESFFIPVFTFKSVSALVKIIFGGFLGEERFWVDRDVTRGEADVLRGEEGGLLLEGGLGGEGEVGFWSEGRFLKVGAR